tara:strand:- start:425 stop:604 length:180 start_codon:yes stop_codon:yes gene_type:complete
MPTPTNAKKAVIQVALFVFSPRIKIEKSEAKIGDVAKQNKINETDVSAIPYVNKKELIT